MYPSSHFAEHKTQIPHALHRRVVSVLMQKKQCVLGKGSSVIFF